LKHKEDQRALK
jgi:hypothetical protein